jgi:hypothetical protein
MAASVFKKGAMGQFPLPSSPTLLPQGEGGNMESEFKIPRPQGGVLKSFSDGKGFRVRVFKHPQRHAPTRTRAHTGAPLQKTHFVRHSWNMQAIDVHFNFYYDPAFTTIYADDEPSPAHRRKQAVHTFIGINTGKQNV